MDHAAIKILLVDDEPDIIDILTYNLKKEGFDVYSANNAIAGIEIARREIPQLIILDVMMRLQGDP
jgi:two-component system, OmpR family, alkaline phosphatase synthesis response regulator PhoP